MGNKNKERDKKGSENNSVTKKPATKPSDSNNALANRRGERVRARARVLPPGVRTVLEDDEHKKVAASPAAKKDQERNAALLRDSAHTTKNDTNKYGLYTFKDGKLIQIEPREAVSGSMHDKKKEQTVFLLHQAVEKMFKDSNGDTQKVYSNLILLGKDLKKNPTRLLAFVGELITMLNAKYDKRKTHDSAGKGNVDVLNNFLRSNGNTKNLICGPIAQFVVSFLNDIGVEAAVISGHALRENGKNTGHYVVMYKIGAQEYAFMGGALDNFTVNAPNSEIALRRAMKISDKMASSGYLTIQGLKNNETYSRYMLADEAAFGEGVDYHSDQKLLSANTFLSSINTLDANERTAVGRQVANAQKSGLRLSSITVEGGSNVTDTNKRGAVRVVLEGVNKNGERRLVIFDTAVARDQQKMSALWYNVSKTSVETMTLQLESRRNKNTENFDASKSYGVHGSYEQTFRRGSGAHVFSGELTLNTTTGQSLTYSGDDKTSDFRTMMIGNGYRYVSTAANQQGLRLNLWVGGNWQISGTQASHKVKNSPPSVGERRGGATVGGGTALVSETAGAQVTGASGRTRVNSTLSFTLLQEGAESDPSKQRSSFQHGFKIDHSTGVAYNLGRGAQIDGAVNVVYLRTPVFDKQMASAGIGVGLIDVAGVDGLNVRFDTGTSVVREGLHVGSLGSETLRSERNYTGSARMQYMEGRHVYGIEGSGVKTVDRARDTRGTAGYVGVSYSLVF